MLRFRLIILMFVAVIVVAAAAPGGIQAQQNPLRIIASTSILADAAATVAGDAAVVETLFPRGANAHTAEPSAQDVARLSDADLVLVVGTNYEEGLLPVLEEAAGDRLISASRCVPIRPVPEGVVHTHDELDHNEGDDHLDNEEHTDDAEHHESEEHHDKSAVAQACEANTAEVMAAFGLTEIASGDVLGPLYRLDCGGIHEHDDGEEEDIHDAGTCDPHVWSDPVNVALWALLIRDTLSERDPVHAETYAANAARYLGELSVLHTDVAAQMAQIQPWRNVILTNHQTLNYFAARYDLRMVGVILPGGSTSSEPSAQDMLALLDLINRYNVPAIFTENVASDSIAAQLADETGIELVSLYTESLGDPGSEADTYLSYTRYNAQKILDTLSCCENRPRN
jgi:ABC-type Zn uptake system ZnuABC Zn-binding protein ZnuA